MDVRVELPDPCAASLLSWSRKAIRVHHACSEVRDVEEVRVDRSLSIEAIS